MRLARRPILILAASIALLVGWSEMRTGQREVAVLRTFDGEGRDFFTTLWVVDISGFVWIRAHHPDRRWLSHLHQGLPVELRRAGRSQHYLATIFDDDRTRAILAPRFRDKYGLADRWREWSGDRDPIPVRLQTY